MTDRSAIGRRSQERGAKFECEIVRLLKDAGLTGIYTTRSLQAQRRGDGDIEGTPWHIEAGSAEGINPAAKLAQAEAAEGVSGRGRPCVAVCREKYAKSITATMRLCCACVACDDADDLDPVTMPVEAWIKRVVRAAGRAT